MKQDLYWLNFVTRRKKKFWRYSLCNFHSVTWPTRQHCVFRHSNQLQHLHLLLQEKWYLHY